MWLIDTHNNIFYVDGQAVFHVDEKMRAFHFISSAKEFAAWFETYAETGEKLFYFDSNYPEPVPLADLRIG